MIKFRETKSLKEYDAVSLAEKLRTYFVDNYPAHIVQMLNDAIQVASYLHRNDVRRGARGKNLSPAYIEHPLRVAVRLIEYFHVKSPSLIIAAVLHDTVEDHPFEFQDFEGVYKSDPEDEVMARQRALAFIANHFGFPVASIVEKVSNPIFVGTRTKEEKIAAYQHHVGAAVALSAEAFILKLSDFVDNAGSLHHHYEYTDPKALYFVNRYKGLCEVYRRALDHYAGTNVYLTHMARERLDAVEAQLDKFQENATVEV